MDGPQFEDVIAERMQGGQPQLCGPCAHTLHNGNCRKRMLGDDSKPCACTGGIRSDAYLNYQMGIVIQRLNALLRIGAQLLELTGVATNLEVKDHKDGSFSVEQRELITKL